MDPRGMAGVFSILHAKFAPCVPAVVRQLIHTSCTFRTLLPPVSCLARSSDTNPKQQPVIVGCFPVP